MLFAIWQMYVPCAVWRVCMLLPVWNVYASFSLARVWSFLFGTCILLPVYGAPCCLAFICSFLFGNGCFLLFGACMLLPVWHLYVPSCLARVWSFLLGAWLLFPHWRVHASSCFAHVFPSVWHVYACSFLLFVPVWRVYAPSRLARNITSVLLKLIIVMGLWHETKTCSIVISLKVLLSHHFWLDMIFVICNHILDIYW